MAFQVLVDSVQQRVALGGDSLSVLVQAKDWDIAASTNVFLDGVTGTVFLMPGCYEAGWLTSNSGIYAKIPYTALTLSPAYAAGPPPNWMIQAPNPDGAAFYKFPNNSGGASGITTEVMAVNQPMVVEMSIGGTTASTDLIGDVGWGDSADYTSGVSLRFYRDFSADIWKAGTFLAHLTISGQIQEYGQTDGQIPNQPSVPYVGFLLIPCRERELLVLCSAGGGFSYTFEDIPEGTSSPTITPAAPFWFYAPPGVDQAFRLAKCQFEATGNAVSKQTFWTIDPGASPTGGFQKYIDTTANGGSVSLAIADGLNPSAPYNDNTNGVRLNVTLTGGSKSPEVYAARGYTVAQTVDTVGPALDVSDYALALTYDSSDSVGGVRASITLRDPKAIIAAGVVLDGTNQPGAMIDAISERPWQLYDDDGTQFLEGLNDTPKLEEGIVFDESGQATYGTSTNRNERVRMDIRDGWMAAENFTFQSLIPLDGLSIAQVFQMFSQLAGFDAPDLSADLSTTYINQAGNPTTSFNLQVEVNDKLSEWIDRIVKSYCSNYFVAMTPAGAGKHKLQVLAEADLPSTPAVTLYDSLATAVANGVSNPTPYDLFRTLDVQMLKPEANDVTVRGKDYRTLRPIIVHNADDAPGGNMDPTTAPASRTPAWRGSRVSYCWTDPSIADQDTAIYADNLMFSRITIARSLIEFECDFYGILPRGSLVKLYFATGGGVRSAADGTLQNPVTARIKSVSARFEQVNNTNVSKWRPTRYVAQVGTDASMLHSQGTNLNYIRIDWALRAISKSLLKGDDTDRALFNRPFISHYQVP